MKKFAIYLMFIVLVFGVGCTNILDKEVNTEDFPKVIELIKDMEEYSEMQRTYIVDNFQMEMGLHVMGLQSGVAGQPTMTFREVIEDLASDYGTTLQEKIEIRKQNKQISEFSKLIDAKAMPIDRYEGYFIFDIEFNNTFDREVLYIILSYKYVDKYDVRYFQESARITDQVAGDFVGVKQIMLHETYNDASRFMASKVPIQASLALREEIGVEEANEKVNREFMMEGLTIETTLVVFTDKSEISMGYGDWEYFDERYIVE
jgi:hypothetical protein